MAGKTPRTVVLLVCRDNETLDDIHHAFSFCMPEIKVQTIKPGIELPASIADLNPDVIVLDIDDHAAGIKSLKNIKKLSQAALITLSYSIDEQTTVQALEYGTNDHIVKPIKQMEFIARVRSLLNIRQQMVERQTS